MQEPIDISKHLQAILKAIDELMGFHARTAAPAPIPHQYVGTHIDNTVALLTVSANALDGGNRTVSFSDNSNWLSLMQAVHRSFFSSLQIAVEKGLADVCCDRGLQVHNRLHEGMESAVAQIDEAAGDNETMRRHIKHLRPFIKPDRPNFNDYLESVLANLSVPPETKKQTKKQWRRFFLVLSIVRNKASHSDVSLTDHEREALRQGEFGDMISTSERLVINPEKYAQFATLALQFLDLICRATPPASGGN